MSTSHEKKPKKAKEASFWDNICNCNCMMGRDESSKNFGQSKPPKPPNRSKTLPPNTPGLRIRSRGSIATDNERKAQKASMKAYLFRIMFKSMLISNSKIHIRVMTKVTNSHLHVGNKILNLKLQNEGLDG
jgi:hypothetical protein